MLQEQRKKLRVYIAVIAFVSICLCTTVFGSLGAVLFRRIPSRWDWYRYQVERTWADTVYLFVRKWCMKMPVKYTGVPKGALSERPLLLLGVHQGDLLHGLIGSTFLRLAGGPVRVVVKQEISFLLRHIMSLLGIGTFVNRKDTVQATQAIADAFESDPQSATAIYPEGTRPKEDQIAWQRETYQLPWLINTPRPRRRGVWTYLCAARKKNVTPRVFFLSHRTEIPDWKFEEFYHLVGTTVEVYGRDISDRLNACTTEEEVGEFLNTLYEEENIRRGWSKTIIQKKKRTHRVLFLFV